jgi:hypothetical protein
MNTIDTQEIAVLLNHIWTVALPLLQPVADAQGFGDEWRTMTTKKTEAAAWAAAREAEAAAWAARAAGAEQAAREAWAAAEAAEAAARAGDHE